MREENSRSDFTAGRDFQAEKHDIEIGQQSGQHRDPTQHGRSARSAKHDGQKAVVQQAPDKPGKAGSSSCAALKGNLSSKIAMQKLF
jgi:hypothetical protein